MTLKITSIRLDKKVTQKLQKRGYNVSKCVRNYLSKLEKETRKLEVLVNE